MERQELKDIPRTKEEARCQKGHIPLTAIFLALGLLAVLILFFGPVWMDFAGTDPSVGETPANNN